MAHFVQILTSLIVDETPLNATKRVMNSSVELSYS